MSMDLLDEQQQADDGGAKQDGDSERFKPYEDRIARLEEELAQKSARESEWLQAIRDTALAGRKEEKAEPKPDLLSELAGSDEAIDAEKLIEALTKDPKGALAKAGFLTRREAAELSMKAAERLADKKIAELEEKWEAREREREAAREADAKLYGEFPELRDEEFFGEVSKEMRTLTGGDPKRMGDPALIRAACRVVKAAQSSKGEPAGDTLAGRMAAQARGGVPRRSGAAEPAMATVQARDLAGRFAAAGFKVKPEDIK